MNIADVLQAWVNNCGWLQPLFICWIFLFYCYIITNFGRFILLFSNQTSLWICVFEKNAVLTWYFHRASKQFFEKWFSNQLTLVVPAGVNKTETSLLCHVITLCIVSLCWLPLYSAYLGGSRIITSKFCSFNINRKFRRQPAIHKSSRLLQFIIISGAFIASAIYIWINTWFVENSSAEQSQNKSYRLE